MFWEAGTTGNGRASRAQSPIRGDNQSSGAPIPAPIPTVRGTDPDTTVPTPGRDLIVAVPSTASIRSRMFSSPWQSPT